MLRKLHPRTLVLAFLASSLALFAIGATSASASTVYVVQAQNANGVDIPGKHAIQWVADPGERLVGSFDDNFAGDGGINVSRGSGELVNDVKADQSAKTFGCTENPTGDTGGVGCPGTSVVELDAFGGNVNDTQGVGDYVYFSYPHPLLQYAAGMDGNDNFVDSTPPATNAPSDFFGGDPNAGTDVGDPAFDNNDPNGNDYLSGGPGDDFLYGQGGADWTTGEGGNDHIYGGDGDDFYIYGGDGDDVLDGGAGNDGGSANGNPSFDGGDGADQMSGGSGNDLMGVADRPTSTDEADVVNGGAGQDTAWYSSTHNVTVTLDGQANDGVGDPGVGSVDNIGPDGDVENVTTGNGDDTLIGDAQANDLNTGPSGNDGADGGGGDDTVEGSDLGSDILVGGTGADNFVGGVANEVIRAQDGEADNVSCGGDNDNDQAYVDFIDHIASLSQCEQRFVVGAPATGNSNQTQAKTQQGQVNAEAALLGQVAASLNLDLASDAKLLGKLHFLLTLLRKHGFNVQGNAVTAGDEGATLTRVGAGTATAAKKKIVIAKGKRSYSAAGRSAIKVKLTKKGKKLLRHARKVKATLTLQFKTRSGKVVKRSKKVTLKR